MRAWSVRKSYGHRCESFVVLATIQQIKQNLRPKFKYGWKYEWVTYWAQLSLQVVLAFKGLFILFNTKQRDVHW